MLLANHLDLSREPESEIYIANMGHIPCVTYGPFTCKSQSDTSMDWYY